MQFGKAPQPRLQTFNLTARALKLTLNLAKCCVTMQVRVGRLLAGVADGDAVAVAVQLRAARAEIMAPLSAAAMESYARAYPHLVRLHMLQELADAAALLQVLNPKRLHPT